MRLSKKIILFVLLITFISLLSGITYAGLNLSCWFEPTSDEPNRQRYTVCNFTNETSHPMTDANIFYSTYDINDWYKTGELNNKGWIAGYNSISSINNTTLPIDSTIRTDMKNRVHLRYGRFNFPYPQINLSFNTVFKAGTGVQDLRILICNENYSNLIFGNTPIIIKRPKNSNFCQFAGIINGSGFNTENWTWASIDITEAYNNITKNQTNLSYFSINIASDDNFSIDPTTFSISDDLMPPLDNNTLSFFALKNSTYTFKNINSIGLPNNNIYNETRNINMSNNLLLYHMNDTSGNILDYSGNNNIGIVSGTLNYSIPGKFSEGVYLEGKDFIETPLEDFDDISFTLEIWIKSNIAPNRKLPIFSNHAFAWHDSKIYLWKDSWSHVAQLYLRNYTQNISATIVGNIIIDDNKWHHIVAVIDKTTDEAKLYVDSILEGTTSIENISIISTGQNLTIGRERNHYFKGSLDEASIYNRSLDIDEIYIRYINGKKLLIPDNRTFTYQEYLNNKNHIEMSDSLGFASDIDFLSFDENEDVAIFKNISHYKSLRTGNHSQCGFLRRSNLNTDIQRLIMWGRSSWIYLKDGEIKFRVYHNTSVNPFEISTSNQAVNDTDYHLFCIGRDTAKEQLWLQFDGENVDTIFFNNSWIIKDFNEVILGKDTISGGNDNYYRGELGFYLLSDEVLDDLRIIDNVNPAFWKIAISPQEYPGIYAKGELYNDSHFNWISEPTKTPIAYLQLYDNRTMTYNVSSKLYESSFYNGDYIMATQDITGVNATTLFNTNYESTIYNDTQYFYTSTVEGSTCTIHSYNWTIINKTGQFQQWYINWSVNSTIPVITKGLVVRNPSGCEVIYDTEGMINIMTEEFGNSTFSCYSKNSIDITPYYSSNETFNIGCWSAYDDFDGTHEPMEIIHDNLHLCEGFHTTIPKNKSSIFQFVSDGKRPFITGLTILDGGNIRYGNGSKGMIFSFYNLSNYWLDGIHSLRIQNAEIGMSVTADANNLTLARGNFVNVTTGFNMRHTSGENISLINNFFNNYGIDGGEAIYLSGDNVRMVANRFNNPNIDCTANVKNVGGVNNILEQNYYGDIENLNIYTDGINRTTSEQLIISILPTIFGEVNFTCIVGTSGNQYPYNASNGAFLINGIQDLYPCTTKISIISEEELNNIILSLNAALTLLILGAILLPLSALFLICFGSKDFTTLIVAAVASIDLVILIMLFYYIKDVFVTIM